MTKIKKIKGTVIIKELQFTRMLEREVIKNNETSGKLTLPKELIGKKVVVIWNG